MILMQKKKRTTAGMAVHVGVKRILPILLVFVVIAGAAVLAVQFINREPEEYTQSRNVFLNNIIVNGIDIGGKSFNDALDAVVLQAQQAQNG